MTDHSSNPAAPARRSEAPGTERRAEARYLTDDPAEIEVRPGPSEPIPGTILDISPSGLRVAVSQRVERGENVKVKLHRNIIFGEVRYCRPVQEGFQAGIHIHDMVRPSGQTQQHIADQSLSLYAAGKGLSVVEFIDAREHLAQCGGCRARLAQLSA